MKHNWGSIIELIIDRIATKVWNKIESELPRLLENHYRSIDSTKLLYPGRCCTSRDVQELLSISKPTLHKMVRQGLLHPIKLGNGTRSSTRYILREVEELIESRRSNIKTDCYVH